MIEKSFGAKIPNEEYRDRIGAYAIIFNERNKVAVVKTPYGYLLLGGGLERNESHEACITRECIEEAGLLVKVGDFICKGDKYHWSDVSKSYLHGIGYFYFASVMKAIDCAIEDDHELVWLSVDGCYDKLFLEHQVWAVQQAVLQRSK